jgi:hypothetical protein
MPQDLEHFQIAHEFWSICLHGLVIFWKSAFCPQRFTISAQDPKNCGIRLIVSGIHEYEKGPKKRAEYCSHERPYFEIIEIPKMHDKWIGAKESHFIQIGTDLKSESLGK